MDIDLGDKTLTWARNRKGNPKETYRLCEGDSELRSEDRSRGKVPDWVSQKDVLGIALVAQLAADTCKEAGLSAAATAIELCGRVLALLQALPLLQSLLGSFAAYLQ